MYLSSPFALATLAVITGFTSGILGAGGGILFIPLALFLLPIFTGQPMEIHEVTALALVQGVAAVIGGGVNSNREGRVDMREILWAGPVLAATGLLGALVSARTPGRALLIAFAVVTTGAAALLLVKPRELAHHPGPLRRAAGEGAFAGIGLLGGALGVGAGFLSIPTLVYLLAVPLRVASGTGLVLTLFLAGPALVGKAITGQVPWPLAAMVATGALLGSALGSRLSGLVAPTALRGALAVVVAVLAIRVWVDVL